MESLGLSMTSINKPIQILLQTRSNNFRYILTTILLHKCPQLYYLFTPTFRQSFKAKVPYNKKAYIPNFSSFYIPKELKQVWRQNIFIQVPIYIGFNANIYSLYYCLCYSLDCHTLRSSYPIGRQATIYITLLNEHNHIITREIDFVVK